MSFIRRLVAEEEGADATEYALVLGLVAMAIVVGAAFLGGSISNALNAIGGRVTTCTTSGTNNASC